MPIQTLQFFTMFVVVYLLEIQLFFVEDTVYVIQIDAAHVRILKLTFSSGFKDILMIVEGHNPVVHFLHLIVSVPFIYPSLSLNLDDLSFIAS